MKGVEAVVEEKETDGVETISQPAVPADGSLRTEVGGVGWLIVVDSLGTCL